MNRILSQLAFLTLTLVFPLKNVFSATKCPMPRENAATAFKLIETPSSGSLQKYLDEHIVSKTAKNERCETMYLTAIRTRNEEARKFLDQIGFGPKNALEINALDNDSNSSVFSYGLQYGTLKLINELRQRGGVLDGTDGLTEFMVAAKSNSLDVVKSLENADADAVDKNNYHAFHFAASSNRHANVIEYFLRKGIDINLRANDKMTPLMLAADQNSLEIVNLLVKAGADVNAGNGLFIRPLAYAARRNDGHQIVSSLLSAGAEVDAMDMNFLTALFLASINSKESVKILLKAGASVDMTDVRNASPLSYAVAYNEDVEVIKILLNAGADINLGNPLLVGIISQASKEKIGLLLSAGVNIHAIGRDNETALMMAARESSYEIIKLLLNAGATKGTKNKHGQTAYDIAVAAKRSSSIISLLQYY